MLCAELLFGSQMLALIRLSISLHTWSYLLLRFCRPWPLRALPLCRRSGFSGLGVAGAQILQAAGDVEVYAVNSGPPLLPHQVWKDVLLFGLCVSLAKFEDSQT